MAIRRTVILLILALILLMQVGLRLPFLDVPLERDEGTYGYMAQRILAGELPYRDAFDHKPPLTYYLYAQFVKFGGNTIQAVRVPTLIYSFLTTLAVAYLGWLLFGSAAGLLAAFLFALFSGGVLIQGSSSNTEVFMLLPLVLALALFLKGLRQEGQQALFDCFLAGLLSGTAVMFKQTAALNLVILPLFLFSRSEGRLGYDWRKLLALAGGSLVLPGSFTLYFLLKGAGADYFYHIVTVNRTYIAALDFGPFARMLHGLYTTYMTAKLENSVLWFFAMIGLVYFLIKERVRDNVLLVAWALASLAGVCASGFFFGHYYIQVIPALCLLSAYALVRVFRESGLALKAMLLFVTIFLLFNMLPYQYRLYSIASPDALSLHQYGKASYVVAKKVSDKLKPELKPDDTVFVWAADPEVYFYLAKRAPGRYFNNLGWLTDPAVRQDIVRTVVERPPDYIVWTDYVLAYPELVDLVRKDYRLWMGVGGWRVYKKQEAAQ